MPDPLQSGTSRYPIVLGDNGELKKLVPADDVLEAGEVVITLDSSDFTALVVDGTTNALTDNSENPRVIKAFRDINYGTSALTNASANDFRLYVKHTAATVPATTEFYAFSNQIVNTGKIVNDTAGAKVVYLAGALNQIDEDGEWDSNGGSALRAALYGTRSVVRNDATYTDTSGTGVTNAMFCRAILAEVRSTPILSSGNLNVENTGVWIYVLGDSVGSSTGYGIYIYGVSGSDTNYGVYDASGADWRLATDNQKLRLGAGGFDCNLYSDGTGAVLHSSQDVYLSTGSGNVKFGTHAAITTETLSGYITIKDAGGTTRKLAVVS